MTYDQMLNILKQFPNNPHYLTRYVKFIQRCQSVNQDRAPLQYCERHHILPKHKNKFPMYKNLSDYPWNKAVLTYRQHIIAHYILFRAYGTVEESLAVMRVIAQFHRQGTPLQVRYLQSKQYDDAKRALSDKRKGVCLRGPVTHEERERMSTRQKLRYQDPENRRRHAEACVGVKHAMTPKRMAADEAKRGRKMSADVVARKSKSQTDKYWERIADGVARAYWVTPFGVFSQPPTDAIRSLCNRSEIPINIHVVKSHPFLSRVHIGICPRELGFWVESAATITSTEQYRGHLGQVHLLEPSHPLSSTLNDYLLQKNFLHQ